MDNPHIQPCPIVKRNIMRMMISNDLYDALQCTYSYLTPNWELEEED